MISLEDKSSWCFIISEPVSVFLDQRWHPTLVEDGRKVAETFIKTLVKIGEDGGEVTETFIKTLGKTGEQDGKTNKKQHHIITCKMIKHKNTVNT